MNISNSRSESFFNLQENIDKWIDRIKVEPSITEVDIEELRSHFLDIIDDLKTKGLDDEEAFLIASKRLSVSDEVINEYRQENNGIYQMQRSLIILGGVLLYFLIYTFIISSSNILFITSYSLGDSDGIFAIDFIKRYLISWHFIIAIFFASVFFLENKTISLIEKIRLKPWHTL